jgi:hypothetical protein
MIPASHSVTTSAAYSPAVADSIRRIRRFYPSAMRGEWFCYTETGATKRMQALWEDLAVRMLDRRDRFTRPAIEEEFERYLAEKPVLLRRSIEFDRENGGYLTPVFDDRFSVVWYDRNEGPCVRAVVPTARFSRQDPQLKSRVKEIVQIASENKIELP